MFVEVMLCLQTVEQPPPILNQCLSVHLAQFVRLLQEMNALRKNARLQVSLEHARLAIRTDQVNGDTIALCRTHKAHFCITFQTSALGIVRFARRAQLVHFAGHIKHISA
jgi:hypothetical protein